MNEDDSILSPEDEKELGVFVQNLLSTITVTHKRDLKWLILTIVEHLREMGCKCESPSVDYSPGYGPRCSLCNTDAKDIAHRLKQELSEARRERDRAQMLHDATCFTRPLIETRTQERDALQKQVEALKQELDEVWRHAAPKG